MSEAAEMNEGAGIEEIADEKRDLLDTLAESDRDSAWVYDAVRQELSDSQGGEGDSS